MTAAAVTAVVGIEGLRTTWYRPAKSLTFCTRLPARPSPWRGEDGTPRT